MSPGRVARLGDPDLGFRAVLQKHFAHPSDLCVPTVPPEFKRAREAVNADCIDVLHYAAFAHQSHPLRVHWAARPKHSFFAALTYPMRRTTDHLTKNQPVRIESGIPLQRTARFVPKLDPLRKFSEATNENVQKIRVLFWITRWRALTWSDTKTWRRIMKTGKNVDFASKT